MNTEELSEAGKRANAEYWANSALRHAKEMWHCQNELQAMLDKHDAGEGIA